MSRRFKAAARYYKTHIWIEIFSSVALVSVALLAVFYFYVQNQYYNRLMAEIRKSDGVMISAAANSLNNVFASQLRIGGEIAVSGELYDVVDTVVKSGEMTVVENRLLRNELSAITHYSEDIAAVSVVGESGLICEFERYWDSNGTPILWSNDNLDTLMDMYRAVLRSLENRGTGYYYVSTEPAWRTDPPVMNLYHIAFPLIGTQNNLRHVEAAVVISYRMDNITRTSALADTSGNDDDFRFIADAEGRMIYHEDPARIGQDAGEYLEGLDAMVLEQPLDYFGWRVAIAVDQVRIREDVRQMYLKTSVLYILVILAAIFGWALLLQLILKPVSVVKDAMESAERGEEKRIEIRGEHEIWSLAAEYNDMLDALDEQREIVQQEYMEKMRMDALRSRAQRLALESRINAHFIFNTLNAIHYSAMDAGDEESAHMIKQLSNILRYTLSPDAEVTLGREFDIAVQYLALQKYRLMDKFEYEIDFPAEYSEWPCCKLFLQPFIENSIMHGFASVDTGGRIDITGREDHGRFRVEISDNGCGMSAEVRDRIRESMAQVKDFEAGGRGIGIRNVILRMKMFFGPAFEVALDSAPGEGTRFTFWLPIPGMPDDEEEQI